MIIRHRPSRTDYQHQLLKREIAGSWAEETETNPKRSKPRKIWTYLANVGGVLILIAMLTLLVASFW